MHDPGEFVRDLAAFVAGAVATVAFYFLLLFLFGDGEIPGLLYDFAK
jgi:hypothetical protein